MLCSTQRKILDRFALKRSVMAMSGVLVTTLGAAYAQAQDSTDAVEAASQSQSEAVELQEIVVTGTLIRGAEPVGSNSQTFGLERIEETAAISANDLLSSIPQITNQFNQVPLSNLNIAVNQVQTARPEIRSLGNAVVATSPTLVLINGHRIAGVGTTQSSVDPDLIPMGAIERVDVMSEGGSATYGADAVAGVINFITRRRFDGVQVSGNLGFGEDYDQWSGSIIAGKDWGTGSAFFSYSNANTDALFRRDRDYARELDYSSQPYVGADFTCANPNLTNSPLLVAFIGGPILSPFGAPTPYAAPDFVQGTANRCDNSQNSTMVPESERQGLFLSLTQEVGDSTVIDVRAFHGERETEARSEAVGVVGLGSNNPAAAALPEGLVVGDTGMTFFGFPIENRALVNFSFAPVLGPNPLTQTVDLEEWGTDFEITHNINDNWQIKGLANYSESESFYNLQQINQARLDAAGSASDPASAINPLDITSTNRALIDDLIDNELAAEVHDEILQLRAIAEGEVFTLPGGEVRLAIGYEYMDQALKKRQANDIRRGTLGSFSFAHYDRDVNSYFAELLVPLIGDGNAVAGAQSLMLSLAVREDDYSDFGKTTNPKIGISYEPFDGLRIRGNWGTSFTAPNALDQLGGVNNIFGVGNTHPFVPAGHAPDSMWYTVTIQGANTPLSPQEADTWSLGFDIEPADGVNLSASYYEIEFTDILSIPTPSADIFDDFPTTNFVSATGELSADLVRSFASQVDGGLAQVDPLLNAGAQFYSLIDFRVGNYGILNIAGLDFSASWVRDTSFGSFDLGLNGNYQLDRDEQVSNFTPVRDQLDEDASLLSMRLSGGVNIGDFRAQATLNHSQGYDLTPTNSAPPQVEIDDYNTVDLFFKYDLGSRFGDFEDVSVTLNIDNVFDEDPPELRRTQPGDGGFGNGFTLGRMFILGATVKF